MALTRLDIFGLRNIERASLTPSPRLNVLVGENGSGKTSALEAIYLLGRARSFRTTHAAQLLQFQKPELVVAGEATRPDGGRTALGVRLTRRERDIRLGGQRVHSSVAVLRAFPVLLIHPATVSLLEGAPKLRRQFVDWGVFHVEPSYLEHWRRYAKALNQRNALLRQGRPADPDPWDQELARYGTIVAEARGQYLRRLQPHLDQATEHFLPGCSVRIEYSQGWKPDRNLLQAIRDDFPSDREYGYTQSGPHKADFALWTYGKPAKSYLSRGQIKLMVCALLLGQANLLDGEATPVCLLIDDLASELDRGNRRRLLDLLRQRQSQCFVTALQLEEVGLAAADDAAMFHVEQGRISPTT